jgi:hypothetical protein
LSESFSVFFKKSFYTGNKKAPLLVLWFWAWVWLFLGLGLLVQVLDYYICCLLAYATLLPFGKLAQLLILVFGQHGPNLSGLVGVDRHWWYTSFVGDWYYIV